MSAAESRPSDIDRIARWIAVAASTWFAFTAVWGLFALVTKGHTGSAPSGVLLVTEPMVRWHLLYPSWDWYALKPPTPDTYYTHHPFGVFYAAAPFLFLFGHHDFVTRLPSVLMSIATPPLLYGSVRKAWGAPGAAAAVCGFVVMPIAVGFSNFHNLEVMTLFGWALFFWGHARYLETRLRRHLFASLAGVVVATSADWPGYVAIGVVLAWGLLRGFVLPRRLVPPCDRARYARWWALSAALAVGLLLFWIALFVHAGRLDDWLTSAVGRGAGSKGPPLKAVLESRKVWIDFCFTPLAIRLGKWAAPLFVLRLLVRRRDEEIFGLAVLVAAVVQYVGFPQGADVHIFWPHHFALYFGYALGALVTTAGGVVRFVLARLRLATAAAAGGAVALVLGVAASLVLLPDAWRALVILRATGGRYDDHGTPIYSGVDASWVLERFVKPHMLPGMAVDTHPSLDWYWEDAWAAGANNRSVSGPPRQLGPANVSHPFFVARASAMSPDEQKRIAQSAHVRVYGDIWLIDEREAAAPLDAYRVDEADPNPLQWLLLGGVEPVRSTTDRPDPFLTWEWRTHLGLPDATPPAIEPRTLDELRIAHNAALERGDTAAAEHYREQIDAQIDRTVAARFDDGTRIIGVRVTRGMRGRLQVWFEAGDGPRGDDVFVVHSSIERAEPLSLVPASPVVREMAWADPLPPALWKKGFLYTADTTLLHRIGIERYKGSWRARDAKRAPRRVDGQPETSLALVR